MHGKSPYMIISQGTYNTVQNLSKLIDLVIKIKLNRAILMPRFSDFVGNRIINFPMFECLVTCFLRVAVYLLCRLQAVSKIHVLIYPCLIISERIRNCPTFWSAQPAKPRLSGNMLPNISTCENGCWYFSENFRIVALKLLEFTQLASPNLSIYYNFLSCREVRCDDDIFKPTAHARTINSESLCTVLCYSTFCSILKIK